MQKISNVRALAAILLYKVIVRGQSLNALLTEKQQILPAKDKALLAELCYGVLRTLPQEEFILKQLMNSLFRGKNQILHFLLCVGLYQLLHTRIPPHAAIYETVMAATSLDKGGLKNVINGVLRQFQRQQATLMTAFEKSDQTHLHPDWLYHRIKTAYPEHADAIFNANNRPGPMWLRVNRLCYTAKEYLDLLAKQGILASIDVTLPYAICLAEPVPVKHLPEFDQGAVTVQDRSAQYAAILLDPQAGESILDMCAAPGGKTTHILELEPTVSLIAVDNDPVRLNRISDNLHRLQQNATLIKGDGCKIREWIGDRTFDRILVDAPCSATGVIRRHPDIKWLRRDTDIAPLVQVQQHILTAVWPYLKPGGILVYATCSILPDENQDQIKNFLTKTLDASLTRAIIQHFPDQQHGDGFFYAVLKKALSNSWPYPVSHSAFNLNK